MNSFQGKHNERVYMHTCPKTTLTVLEELQSHSVASESWWSRLEKYMDLFGMILAPAQPRRTRNAQTWWWRDSAHSGLGIPSTKSVKGTSRITLPIPMEDKMPPGMWIIATYTWQKFRAGQRLQVGPPSPSICGIFIVIVTRSFNPHGRFKRVLQSFYMALRKMHTKSHLDSGHLEASKVTSRFNESSLNDRLLGPAELMRGQLSLNLNSRINGEL